MNNIVFDSSQPQITPDVSRVRNLKTGEEILHYTLNIRTSDEYSLRTAMNIYRLCGCSKCSVIFPLQFLNF